MSLVLVLALSMGCQKDPCEGYGGGWTAEGDDCVEVTDDTGDVIDGVDADGDGFDEDEDCDDTDPAINPDAEEICDGIDNNCDDQTDEGVQTTFYSDADGDGYGDDATAVDACEPESGQVDVGGDCDDTDTLYNPLATEDDCTDPNDYNCDGSVGYDDADADGYAACEECDDSDAAIFPGADEYCDDVDNNCDGTVDEDTALDTSTWYADTDTDGFGDAASTTAACDEPSGYVGDNTDCDDTNVDVYPGATEICNDIDDDCDGDIDSTATDAPTWYADTDGDSYGDASSSLTECDQPSSYVSDDTDCDDTANGIYPGADEYCDEVDNNCDGSIDEDTAVDADTWYADSDSDGFGDASVSSLACSQPTGAVSDDSDCDDTDNSIYPGADEYCDGVDNDCDTDIDEDDAVDASTYYTDSDGDGYGDASSTVTSCSTSSGVVSDDTDCDDTDNSIYPGADEYCDSVDNDCDTDIDEDDAVDADTFYADSDDDGYGDPAVSTTACSRPTGYRWNLRDCDDSDPDISPLATEVCDYVDNDCDGDTDFDVVPTDYTTIQDAIDALSDGDGVCVEAGTYVELIDLGGKNLYIESFSGSGSTTIDGAGDGPVVIVNSGESAYLGGFTLTDGENTGLNGPSAGRGAAIYLDGSTLELSDIEISDNYCSASRCRGSVYVEDSSLTMTDVTLKENLADASSGSYAAGLYAKNSTIDWTGGGAISNVHDGADEVWSAGMHLQWSDVALKQLAVIGNESTSDGADVYSAGIGIQGQGGSTYTVTLDNVVIAGNYAEAPLDEVWSAGIWLYDHTDAQLTNVTIEGNEAVADGVSGVGLTSYSNSDSVLINTAVTNNIGTGDSVDGTGIAVPTTTGSVTLTYCNVYGNTVDYWNTTDMTGVDGNISVDPGYNDNSSTDPADWELGLSASSGMVDAGDPSLTDVDGTTSDIGAYGGPDGEW